MLLSASARAEEPGQDEVTLKNGGTIRGTVVSSEPGTSVKIIEAGQKEVRVIPWSQVSDVEKGKYAPRAPAPAQPGPGGPGYWVPPAPPQMAPPPQPEAKMGDPGVVLLHIDSPLPATMLEQRAAFVGTYYGAYGGYGGVVLTQLRRVCTSPCDVVVDGTQGRTFTLTGESFPAPRPFTFAGMTGAVTLHVEPGSVGRRVGGVLAIVLGASAAVSGAIMIPVGNSASNVDYSTGTFMSTPDTTLRNAGIGMVVGGLVAVGAGIAMVVTGATNVSIEPRGGVVTGTVAQRKPRYWMGEF